MHNDSCKTKPPRYYMWSQCKHCLFKVQEREVLKYSCHVLFTVLITVVPSDWPNAEGGVKWPWCYSRPALVDACKGSSLSWPHGNLLFWGIRENYVAKSRWQGKKQSYRGLLPILPSLLQWDFLGFGLVFFFRLEARTEILPGETEIKQQFVLLSHPVFSYFSLAEE